MKMRQMSHFTKLGLMILVAVVLVGCGRDTSSVESALEGHWTATDARLNGEPLVDVIQEYDEMLDFDAGDVAGSEEGSTEIDTDFYYNEGQLTLLSADGERTSVPYEVIETDEENDALTLEYVLEDPEVNLRINNEITFVDENREAISSSMNIVEADFTEDASAEETSALDDELNQFGEEIAMEILRNMNFQFDLDYVDDATAPESGSE